MATSLATKPPVDQAIEKALIHGDLKDLDTQGRIQFYNSVCASLGLNPLTKPFAYIVLNGKLTLYALRDCTEQLRKIHGVSITKVTPSQIGDLLVVVAEASDRTGRCDSSTGAVSVKGLQGENLANAMMKCETKAKRRVTLSLCGLGLLDESEVDILREQGVAKPEQIAAEEKWKALDPEGFNAPQPGDKLKAELQGSVSEAPFSYDAETGNLNCQILGVIDKKTKPGKNGSRPYVTVTFNGRVEGFNFANCWDTKLFDVLKDGVGKQCDITLRFDGKFLGLVDVLSVDGVELAPSDPPAAPPDFDDLVPF